MDDALLFEKLDTYSKDLRKAAGDLLAVLKKIDNPSKEFAAFLEAVNKLQNSPIHDMDDALLNINQKAEEATLKLTKTSQKQSEQSLNLNKSLMPLFVEKSKNLILEATKLTEKAYELNEKCNYKYQR